jgi:hypothetical protein
MVAQAPGGDSHVAGRRRVACAPHLVRSTFQVSGKAASRLGRVTIRFRLRSAAKGLKDRVSASPDIWDSSSKKEQDSTRPTEDVSAWLQLPKDFKAPDDDWTHYRKSSTFDLSLATDEFDESAWSVYE